MSSRIHFETVTVKGCRVDIAPLDSLSYSRLAARDPTEIEKLLRVCQTPGIFYLDLQDGVTKQWLADLQHVYALSERFFDLPNDLKMKSYREGDDSGYKPGEHEETFEIFRDEIDQKAVLPTILREQADLLERFSSTAYIVTHTMMTCLSEALKLVGDNRFESSHRDGEVSNTGLKLVYEPLKSKLTDVVDNKHTDMGTLTLVFCEQWGVQIEMPDSKDWAFVEPRKGHAIVNVADSLHSLSEKRLYSCLHRVTQPTDGFEKRYYVVYFLRPEKQFKF